MSLGSQAGTERSHLVVSGSVISVRLVATLGGVAEFVNLNDAPVLGYY
jgi:hypothetical protein